MITLADIKEGQKFKHHGQVKVKDSFCKLCPHTVVTPVYDAPEKVFIDPNEGRAFTARGRVNSRPAEDYAKHIKHKAKVASIKNEGCRIVYVLAVIALFAFPFVAGGM